MYVTAGQTEKEKEKERTVSSSSKSTTFENIQNLTKNIDAMWELSVKYEEATREAEAILEVLTSGDLDERKRTRKC